MTTDIDNYENAYLELIRVQERGDGSAEALSRAVRQLQEAEVPLAESVERVWLMHREAVEAARVQVEAAKTMLGRIMTQGGSAARRRNPGYPLLNAAELALVERCREDVRRAVEAHRDAKSRFKAGVTPEQLRDLDGVH